MSYTEELISRMMTALNVDKFKDLALKLGVSPNTVDQWKQRDKVPEKNILKCIDLSGVDKNWLKNGVEPVLPSGSGDTFKIPALEIKASAGEGNNLDGIDSFESWTTINVDKMLFRDKPSKKLRAIQVDGYSMTPMLMPDSWVIFELDRDFEGDGLYIINWRNILMVKQVQLDLKSGHLRIISFNHDYESYDVDPDDQSVFRIIGKVVRAII